MVATEDGQKRIDEIEIGDKVWAYNVETGETELKEVKNVFVHDVVGILHLHTTDGDIDTTTNHPFYVIGKGWVAAGDLTAGDEVYLLDGSSAFITGSEFEELDDIIQVYNLEVEDFHSYFVGDMPVLVHNRYPADRAADKGYPGIKTTSNGGPDFSGTSYLYVPQQTDQKNIVKITMTGSRESDFTKAFEAANIPQNMRKAIRKNYVWHHVDDFNPLTNTCTMQLVRKDAHTATFPHRGSCAQYDAYYGPTYNK